MGKEVGKSSSNKRNKRSKVKQQTDSSLRAQPSIEDDAHALARLIYDIYKDPEEMDRIRKGQNHANRIKDD